MCIKGDIQGSFEIQRKALLRGPSEILRILRSIAPHRLTSSDNVRSTNHPPHSSLPPLQVDRNHAGVRRRTYPGGDGTHRRRGGSQLRAFPGASPPASLRYSLPIAPSPLAKTISLTPTSGISPGQPCWWERTALRHSLRPRRAREASPTTRRRRNRPALRGQPPCAGSKRR